MVIATIGLLVNGTEYFLLGFISIGSAVVFYILFKWLYGGMYKLDPVKYPINPKTRMAKGDLQRFGAYILAFGLYAVVGSLFLSPGMRATGGLNIILTFTEADLQVTSGL